MPSTRTPGCDQTPGGLPGPVSPGTGPDGWMWETISPAWRAVGDPLGPPPDRVVRRGARRFRTREGAGHNAVQQQAAGPGGDVGAHPAADVKLCRGAGPSCPPGVGSELDDPCCAGCGDEDTTCDGGYKEGHAQADGAI